VKERVPCASIIFAILCVACVTNLGCNGLSSAHSSAPAPTTFSISGTISPKANSGGVTVTLSGAGSATTTTDSSGNYSFTGLSSGDYTLTPTKTGFSFSPSSQGTALTTANITGVNFTSSSGSGSGLSVSGNISPAANGTAVIVTMSGAVSATALTDSSGNYSFGNLAAGNYTLTPSKSGFSFSPSSQSATINSANVTGMNFTASADSGLSISGMFSPAADGTGVTVNLSGASSATLTTDSSGNYSFTGLASGNYTLTPSKSGFGFSPSTRAITTTSSNIAGINFVVYPVSQLSPPIVINGQNGTVIDGLTITSTTGNCVTILNSTNITIQNSEIGPCAGNGIQITGGSGINVYDSYIHPETYSQLCCDHNDGIFAATTSNLTIQGNVIAYGESNIEAKSSSAVQVIGNFLLNPRNNGAGNWARGGQFQSWQNGQTGAIGTNILVQNNYALSSQDTTAYLYLEMTADAINFGYTDDGTVSGNYVTGGTFQFGCGINADKQAESMIFESNKLVDTGGCGIAINDGTNHLVTGNRVLTRDPVTGAGNTAISVQNWFQTPGTCGPVTVSKNVATAYQLDGSQTGLYQGQGQHQCNSVTVTNDNVWADAADTALTPADQPPLVPPQPKNCVVISPYSTQTSSAACTR
jgi:Right handed beta helix region/Carboxypeptidase regulatory-like domain